MGGLSASVRWQSLRRSICLSAHYQCLTPEVPPQWLSMLFHDGLLESLVLLVAALVEELLMGSYRYGRRQGCGFVDLSAAHVRL